MRTHTNEFKTAIKEFGREIDSKLTYNGSTIDSENLFNITPILHTELLKSVMKEITIESKVNIPIGSELNYQFGVKTRDENKNLFDINGELYDGTITKYNNGFTLIRGTNRTLSLILSTPLVAGTYTISSKIIENTLTNINKFTIALRDDNSQIKSVYIDSTGKATFTTTATATRLYAYINSDQSNDATITLDNIMIESGSTASPFVEYGLYDHINYGNYIVKDSEYDEATENYIIKAYDKMLYSMKEYTTLQSAEFPLTIREYISALCSDLDLEFANVNDTFVNYDKVLTTDPYANIKYTYRDIFDDLAETTASNICINNNDEVEIRYINGVVPNNYIPLEYIQSTGTQYIDTGINSDNTLKLDMDLEFTSDGTANYTNTFGAIINNGATRFHFNPASSNSMNALIGSDNYTTLVFDNNAYTTRFKSVIDVPNKTLSTQINNTLQERQLGYNTNFDLGINFWLFRRNADNDSLKYYCYFKLYRFKIYQNNVLVRDFVPCKRKSDNAIGLVDVVNDVFYGNQGTGTFSYGNELPDGIDLIDEEYLKDINVKFGEKFGAINTIVLSRSADSDKIARSIPDDLSDEDKIALTIKDNQIMNDDNREQYIDGILNKLYGLEFYLNDFTSTGITYLEACDRYTISANDNTYSCIMFNDEVDITQGLVEQIDTPEPDKSENEYQYMTPTDKLERTTSLIVDKVNSRITAQAEEIEIIATNIDKETGDVNAVSTKEKHFTFNDEGLKISAGDNDFSSLSDETGTYYYDGSTKVGEYTKDGSKQKDLALFGAYKYGMDDINDNPMFVGQLYTVGNETGFGHFLNE